MTVNRTGAIGERIRYYLARRGLAQKELAQLTEIDPSQISRYVTGRDNPSSAILRRIAHELGCHIEDLTASGMERPKFRHNEKPVSFEDIEVHDVYQMFGNHVDPIKIMVDYDPSRLELHPSFAAQFVTLAQQAVDEARGKYDYFPYGPCVRLNSIVPMTGQLPTGREEIGALLNLGPVSWEEYTVLNELMPVHCGDDFVRRFMDLQQLYANPLNLSWCWLSNIMPVLVTPITTDGFGIAQWRARGAVSCASNLLTAGVNENVHRFLDEAPAWDLSHRLHAIDKGKTSQERLWKPSDAEGVPSPLLTAQRGLHEELSPELYRITMEDPSSYKFLNVIFDFHFFHPNLVGIVELPLTMDDAKAVLSKYPGSSHQEHTKIEYIDLSGRDEQSEILLAEAGNWCCWGLSAMISAMHYWRSKRRAVGIEYK